MIIADAKPIGEILEMLPAEGRVLVAGCNGCTAVCQVGGQKEARQLARALGLAATTAGRDLEFGEYTVTRQCEPEFIDELGDALRGKAAVVSVACGVGVQMVAEHYPALAVYPGVDTTFYGTTTEHGVWEERCQGCGKCVLGETFGLCPIARCAKSLLNGPCGGSQQGWCEVGGKTVPCVWDMIVRRAMDAGQVEKMAVRTPTKDWSTARDGGQRRRVRDDLRIAGAAEAMHPPAAHGMPNTHKLPPPARTSDEEPK
jgi:ferredoxin